jgi:hypothetical protein
MANLSVKQKRPATLGDVLYAKAKAPVPEQDWATLVQSIAACDELALHALYERAHRIVFTLMMRITANRETAEELTIDVFHDVSRFRSERRHVDGEAVLHIGLDQSIVCFVDFLDGDDLDIGGDVMLAAEVEHLLRLGKAADV